MSDVNHHPILEEQRCQALINGDAQKLAELIQ